MKLCLMSHACLSYAWRQLSYANDITHTQKVRQANYSRAVNKRHLTSTVQTAPSTQQNNTECI
jgi:hypothetical protein